jgi:hypothetical protein
VFVRLQQVEDYVRGCTRLHHVEDYVRGCTRLQVEDYVRGQRLYMTIEQKVNTIY